MIEREAGPAYSIEMLTETFASRHLAKLVEIANQTPSNDVLTTPEVAQL